MNQKSWLVSRLVIAPAHANCMGTGALALETFFGSHSWNPFWSLHLVLHMFSLWCPLTAVPQTFWHQGSVLWKIIFEEMVSGWFKYITFIVNFISIILSAPPQILKHQILEVGDWCSVIEWWMQVKISLSSVSHSSKLTTEGGSCGNFWLTAILSEAQITAKTCDWHLKWGKPCETKALISGIWC